MRNCSRETEISDVCVAALPKPTIYTRGDLQVFNLLDRPIWVFDIENKAMWWANNAAIELWNADSLEELLARDFADDMSDSTRVRLTEYCELFKLGEKVVEQWTFYPAGKGPTTVEMHVSGLPVESGRFLMLNDGRILSKGELDATSLRGIEILRHLPVSVTQFDMDGHVIHQNPKSIETFGPCLPSRKRSLDGSLLRQDDCRFKSLFVDQDIAQRVFQDVAAGKDSSIEAQLHTVDGPRWSSVEVRRARDPVTGKPSILNSARDITELIEAKKAADEANARKSEFIAVMAHEIRTPLHQVTGFIDLLSQTSLNTEQRGYVSLLQNSCNSLMAVINDLLDYTKLEAGKMELESIPFEPKAVVEGSVESVSTQAERKGLSLSSTICSGLPVKVVGDPNRLRQVILNLLNNAVKFTSHGSIQVSVSTKPSSDGQIVIRFEVEDSGIGIGKNRQAQIFRTYNQADASIARNYGGTGLGLTICERLVQAMKGNIGVESELGQGSKFWFEIPFPSAKGFQSEDADAAESIEHPVGLNVLVADDNTVNQKVAAAMLRRLGHHVTVVDNGEKAVERLESTKFDLVLMDIQMPVLDGIEATKEIRSRGWDCPVVGLTASFQRSQLPFYRQVGMNDCISKPILLKGLRNTIFENVRPKNPSRSET